MTVVNISRWKRAIAPYLCLLLLGGIAAAHVPAESNPTFLPEVRIERVPGKIQIDGQLGDAGWSDASRISSFVERYPGDNATPPVETRVSVTYDDDNLYVAFVCVDDPALIRATMCERDQFGNDDAVAVLLDTYGDASWAYEFFVNPYGIQKDLLWTRVAGEDAGFDLTWHAAAKITDSGYQAEIAIPFSSMRFPNRDHQSWKVDFQRYHPRGSTRQYAWAAYDRDEQCGPCQWGTVDGIQGVAPGKGLEILPTYIAHQSSQRSNPSDPTSNLSNDDINGELSVGGKYTLSSSATLEGTYNPDFSQIESDAAQVDVNTTVALFYPERRPFFQEGADIFRTLFNSFYTRTVNDPEYAVKLVSRSEGLTLGFMSAQDETSPYLIPLEERSELFTAGRSWVNVLRGTKPFGDASQVGFIVTDRRFEGGGYGTILAIDGDLRLSQNYSLDGQIISSFTGEPDQPGKSAYLQGVTIDEGRHTAVFDGESFSGNAMIARLRHTSRDWSFMLGYDQTDPSYRTLTGYDPWVNYRNGTFFTSYRFYPNGSVFQRITPQFYADSRFLFDGTRRWEHQQVSLNSQLTWAQTSVTVSASRSSENWTSDVSGSLVNYANLWGTQLELNSRPTAWLGYYLSAQHQRSVALLAEAIGMENILQLQIALKPIDRLQIEPSMTHVRSSDVDDRAELFRQFITRTRLSYQLNRRLSMRLIVQYNDSRAAIYTGDNGADREYFVWSRKAWDIDPLITYRLNSFSVLYAGSTHDYNYYPGGETYRKQWALQDRQFFLKVQYLLQI